MRALNLFFFIVFLFLPIIGFASITSENYQITESSLDPNHIPLCSRMEVLNFESDVHYVEMIYCDNGVVLELRYWFNDDRKMIRQIIDRSKEIHGGDDNE